MTHLHVQIPACFVLDVIRVSKTPFSKEKEEDGDKEEKEAVDVLIKKTSKLEEI